ncbi:MAG: hypothetical protein WCV72_01335 [Patescibacteria group bacterium]|jgi:hypothetical protein
MLEKLRRDSAEKPRDCADLIDWLGQIIKQNNQVNLEFPNVYEVFSWLQINNLINRLKLINWRQTINARRRKRQNPKPKNCWENPNYKLNQCLRRLITALTERNSHHELEKIFAAAAAENPEIVARLSKIEKEFFKRFNRASTRASAQTTLN